MDWKEVTIYTTTAGIGPVEALLEDHGVEGYVLEDAADFEEFLKDTEIYWDYVDEDLVREKRAQETCLKIYLPDSRKSKICMNITGKIIRKWMSMAMKIMTISRRYSIRFMQMKKSFQRERGLQRCWSLRFLEE